MIRDDLWIAECETCGSEVAAMTFSTAAALLHLHINRAHDLPRKVMK